MTIYILLCCGVICPAQIVTADHGNCEVMVDPDTGEPHTAHTTNLVPVALVRSRLALLYLILCSLFNVCCCLYISFFLTESHSLPTDATTPQAQYGGDNNVSLKNGKLADLIPTMLELMNLEKPDVMDGESLIVRN